MPPALLAAPCPRQVEQFVGGTPLKIPLDMVTGEYHLDRDRFGFGIDLDDHVLHRQPEGRTNSWRNLVAHRVGGRQGQKAPCGTDSGRQAAVVERPHYVVCRLRHGGLPAKEQVGEQLLQSGEWRALGGRAAVAALCPAVVVQGWASEAVSAEKRASSPSVLVSLGDACREEDDEMSDVLSSVDDELLSPAIEATAFATS